MMAINSAPTFPILLSWMVASGALEREDRAIGEGKSKTPAQFILEFKSAVQGLLSRA